MHVVNVLVDVEVLIVEIFNVDVLANGISAQNMSEDVWTVRFNPWAKGEEKWKDLPNQENFAIVRQVLLYRTILMWADPRSTNNNEWKITFLGLSNNIKLLAQINCF